jgi:hypothetical protein
MSILRIRFCAVLAAILILTAHRLPAPIQEVPGSPSPSPTPEARAQDSAIPRATDSLLPTQTGPASFAGSWMGKVDIQRAGEVEVTLVISPDGTSVQQTSKLSTANRPLTYDDKVLSWTGGIKSEVSWTMKLNPDGGSAIITRTFAGKTATATFERVSATNNFAPSAAKRRGQRLRQKSN